MDCNDLNRRVRYALMLDDADVVDLLGFSAYPADITHICGWRLKEGEQGHVKCPPEAIKRMLDGLIVQRRGVKTDASVNSSSATNTNTGTSTSKAAEKITSENGQAGHREIDNNDVLKQLRIALSLKVDDVHALITEGGGKLGKSEVNALFRKCSARNYRRCGDQVLRWFLAGLAARRQSE
ncbi:DUF1456 family protein [Granulosicoccus sp.]|nr:DUF1456 family protein [Granulosicoccus sp.]